MLGFILLPVYQKRAVTSFVQSTRNLLKTFFPGSITHGEVQKSTVNTPWGTKDIKSGSPTKSVEPDIEWNEVYLDKRYAKSTFFYSSSIESSDMGSSNRDDNNGNSSHPSEDEFAVTEAVTHTLARPGQHGESDGLNEKADITD